MAVILLTNDDGIEAEGLRTLEKVLQDLAHIVVVAPDQERSAVSNGLTHRSPLSLKELRPDHFIINGTPADCMIYAMEHLFVRFPDLVISGINHGANVGNDVWYSGTVAAAREASRYGVPSMAVSQYYDDKPIRFKEGAAFVRNLVAAMLQNGLRGEICLNVNLPIGKIKGMKITRQYFSENASHFGSGDSPKADFVPDRQAIFEHYVSITPLQRDQTDYAAAQSLLQEASELFSLK